MKYNINNFKKIKIRADIIKKYPLKLKHIRENNDGYVFIDNGDLVAVISVEKKNDDIWITALEIFDKYKGNGLSYKLLDVATKELKATKLSVNKRNDIAISLYKKYGFKIYDETPHMYFMSIENIQKESTNLFMETMGLTSESLNIDNEELSIMYENVFINKNNVYHKFDKFESGEANVLLITGFSGSGKSTLASQLANKYHCTVYELDCLDFFFQGILSKDNMKNNEDGLLEFLNNHPEYKEKEIPSNSESSKIYDEYINFLINYCKRQKDKKFIIEGLQIYEVFDEKHPKPYFSSTPLIIIGTSYLSSAIRAAKRNTESNTNTNFIKEFKGLLGWVLKDNKNLEKLSKYVKETSNNESIITDSMKKERIKILDEIENRIKESGGTIKISSDSRKCFLCEQKTGGSPVSGPHSICLAGFGKDNYNKSYDIIKGILTDYPNYKISKDNYFTMFLSYKGTKESVYEENTSVIFESDQKSTIDANFNKKPGGHFEFIDIHSPKANKYLKDNKYFIKNFNKIIDITNGEIVVDMDKDKLAGYIYIGGGNKNKNKNYGFIQTLEVIKEYRGYGLSNKLIDDAIKKYNAEDLTVFTDNEVAINLYKKHGFVIIGYGNTKNKSDYWMKHKSKLTTYDHIMMESTNSNTMTFSNNFTDVKKIVDELPENELMYICNGDFKNSPFVVYRECLLINGKPVSFIDIYQLPSMDNGNGAIVIATLPDKKYRNKGYSKLLVSRAIEFSKVSNKISQLIWSFKDGNTISKHMAESIGFKRIGNNEYGLKVESSDYDFEDLESYFKESEESTFIIRDVIFPIVESVLSTPQGDKKFRKLVENFINKNSSKLHTSGPVYMVPFTDRDKEDFFDCFNTTKNELLKPINDMTKIVNDKANWRLLKQNPIFCLFYECIRYYTLKKDNTGVNTALAIYALSVYPSVFSVIFPHGANPDIMQYTIDNLTAKYIMKQAGNVFSALMMSIQNSYRFLRDGFTNSPDVEVIRFIARIRNDQKSMLKNVANNYYANHKQGLRVKTQSETYGNDQLIDDNVNNTSVVEDVTRKITISLITNGVDMTRASAAAKIAGVSISDLRFYLSKIVVEDRTTELQKFVESILFIFLYQEHHKPNEINEKKFLQFAMDLFRRTNSNDVNVVTIKDSLQKWSDDTGVTTRFKRLASQINYKKGIFMYMILCIQYYNN